MLKVRQRFSVAPFFALAAISSMIALFAFSPSASAAQTVPYKMNFQGRLANPSGLAMADGTYNMRFRIYSGAGCTTGCTASWTETRLVSASQGVQVTNGLFSVQLGDVTTLGPSLFTSTDLYFEVELPTTATATTSSPAWTEGAMTPRNKLGSSAYAFNADTIDGIDGASLAQLGSANAFTGNNTYSGTTTQTNLSTVRVTSATAFAVQNAGGTSYLNVNTSTGTITLGTGANTTTISATGIALAGTARSSERVMLSPEYAGATFTGSGTGNLYSDFCSGTGRLSVNTTACAASDEHNYYAWTSTAAGTQAYDVYIRYKVPSDFSSGSLSDLYMYGWRGASASDLVEIALFQANGTQCGTTTNVATGTSAWTETLMAGTLSSCTIAANDVVTIRVRMTSATNGNIVRAGEIRFDYKSTF